MQLSTMEIKCELRKKNDVERVEPCFNGMEG